MQKRPCREKPHRVVSLATGPFFRYTHHVFMKLRVKIQCVLAAAALLCCASQVSAADIPGEYSTGGFFIGSQAYSFNRFTLFEAIEKNAMAGGKVIEFFPGQKISKDIDQGVGPGMSEENMQKVKDKLAQHGMKVVNFGVTGAGDEAGYRGIFEFCKKMDIRAFSCEPAKDHLPILDKLVKEYDVMVAIHNHPRRADDPNYWVWDPVAVFNAVKDLDSRIGASADTGHWVRSGLNPVYGLKVLEGRLISSHMKDLHEFSANGHDVPYGQGVSNIPAVLDELKRQGFKGNISIEYEYNWDNSVPEIAQCIGFVRGYGTAKKY